MYKPAIFAGLYAIRRKTDMKKVNIALSASISDGTVSVRDSYLNSIWQAGGIPTLLPPLVDEEFVSRVAGTFDSFVFCGGGDLDPKYYCEENIASKNICSIRDEFERMLFEAVYKTGKPILGICRGMQVINVFLGGSLHQHIDGHVQNEPRHARTHNVSLIKGSPLSEILGEESIDVNSFHHQVVKVLADGLAVDAMDKDGYIEAFHVEGHRFLLCVQWHPEAYYDHCETSRKIFKAFVEACGNK